MPFDYKKEYKEFYMPPKKPGILEVPEMRFLAVGGKGNPINPDGYDTAYLWAGRRVSGGHEPSLWCGVYYQDE